MTLLDSLLRALAAEHRAQQAPASLDRELSRAFRRRHQRRWLWPALAVTAAAAACAAIFFLQPPPAETLPLRVAAPAAPEVRLTPPPAVVAAARPKLPRPARPTAPVAAPSAPAAEPAPEIATDFFPLRPGPVAESGEWLRVVRARVPRSELRRFGLAAAPAFSSPRLSPDVAADVVLGNDGTARAIRFIHYTH